MKLAPNPRYSGGS